MSFAFGNGRFEAATDPDYVVSKRFTLWKVTHLLRERIPHGFSQNNEYWLPAVDTRTKQPVLIHPRGYGFAWPEDIAFETNAKRIQSLSLPGTVPILHVGRGVVFAEPPTAVPRPKLPVKRAAKHALDAAAITARLHAEGIGRLAFGPSNLRLIDEQMHWLLPGIVELDLLDALQATPPRERKLVDSEARWRYDIDPIQSDLWQLYFFFFSLVEDDQTAVPSTITRLRNEGPKAAGIRDVAALASLFAAIAHIPQTSIDGLPVVRTLPRVYPDWDEVIADGEDLLKLKDHYADSIQLPLAVAYHQRASRSWARGDLDAALVDTDRAISHDAHAPYYTTKAILLNALNRSAEARAAIADAFEHFAKPKPHYSWDGKPQDNSKDMSRTHLMRGILSWHDGQLDEAKADLQRACELHPSLQAVQALEKLGQRRR